MFLVLTEEPSALDETLFATNAGEKIRFSVLMFMELK